MAFKMNRPLIKGTPIHKASIAKARQESIVTQTRTQADSGLVDAAGALGRSYIPAAIDFNRDLKGIEIPRSEEKEEETPRDKKGDKTATKIPRAKKLPNKKQELKLRESIATTNTNTEATDKFQKAAEKFGYDTSTAKGYKEAEDAMEYVDSAGEWINPKVTVTTSTKQEVKKTQEELAVEAEVERKQAKIIQDEKSRAQVERESKLDKALAEKNVKASEKEEIRIKKNQGIRQRNKVKTDAKEYYGDDVKLTKAKLAAYIEMIEEQRAEIDSVPEDIPEQDDIDIIDTLARQQEDLDAIAYKPNVLSDEQTKQVSVKPKPSDFRPKKNAFGGTLTANEQYQKALKEYNSKSPMEMRDDRIYRNAIKGGKLRENMIKGGYTPQN